MNVPQVAETKAVAELLDAEPALTPAQLALAEWLARETLSPLALCFDLMLPPGLSQHVDTLYRLNEPAMPQAELGGIQRRLVELLRSRGPLRARQMDAALPRINWRPSALAMKKRGWLVTQAVLMPLTAHARQVRTVRLAVPRAEIEQRLAEIPRQSKVLRERRRGLLEFLAEQNEAVEVAWAIAGSGGATPADLERLVETGLVAFGEEEVWRDPLERMEFILSEPPMLTQAQAEVWAQVESPWRAPRPAKRRRRTCSTESPARVKPKSTCRRWRPPCSAASRPWSWCRRLPSPRRPCGALPRASPARWGWSIPG